MDTSPAPNILSSSYGYGFVVGLGAAFSIIMIAITKLLTTYADGVLNSESLTNASRSVKSGLIASAVVSSWVWPATLLLSVSWTTQYGVMGGFLYSLGGSVQIFGFVSLAIQLKRIAPGAHTLAELFKIRFGKRGHICYILYVIATNTLVAGCLLLGGAQSIAATGMNVIAASFLLPFFIVLYTSFGGIFSTFLSDWIHTVLIYVICCVVFFVVFGTSSIIGSPGKMYDMILLAEVLDDYNYLTFKHKDAIMLGWSVCIGGLSSVFCDPSYSQKSIASDPNSVLMGYVLGGFCWMSIPFALGTSVGLATRALLKTEYFITYPHQLSPEQMNEGLSLTYGMGSILGKNGAAAAILILFMSVTSSTSSELIAFSSVFTYDVYRGYIKPEATGKQLVRVTHYSIYGFAIFIGCVAVILNYVGVTVSWILSFIGIILTPAVFATILALFWSRMTALSLIIALPLSTVSGILCWIGATYSYNDGVVNKNTLMTTEATIIGNFVSLFSSLFYIIAISLLRPEPKFDFTSLQESIKAGDDANEKELKQMLLTPEEESNLKNASIISIILASILLFGGYIIVMVAYYGSGYTFSKGYFYSWVVIMGIWLLISTVIIIILPLYQGKEIASRIIKSILNPAKEDESTINEVYNGEKDK